MDSAEAGGQPRSEGRMLSLGLQGLWSLPPWGLALATLLLALGALRLLGKRRRRRPGEPPLETGWIPILGLALKFRSDPTRFLLSLQQKHGDIFTVYMAGRYITFVLDPLQFVSVIKNGKHLEFRELGDQISSRAFGHPSVFKEIYPNLSENVHRNYMYLTGKSLDALSDSMMQNLQNIFKTRFSQITDWKMDTVNKFCFSIIFEASFRTLYGRDPGADGDSVTDAIGDKFLKFDAKFSYLAANIPIELLGETKKIRKELINFFKPENMAKLLGVSEVIQERKNIFDMYEALGDYDKAAHHFTFMWASVGNTIPVAFWAMYYLLRDPEALAVVRDEIDHLLQSTGQEKGPDFNIRLTREQLDNLVYLESAINESLRMCSASMNIRFTKEDFILKLEGNLEVSLRKRDYIAIYPPILHMDPEVYQDPEQYKFDRYVENGKKKTAFYKQGKKLKYFLMPFGSGASMCPGRFFAINEIKLQLVLLLTYFDMELLEQKPIGLDKGRFGIGISLPDSEVPFRYKLKSQYRNSVVD